MSATQTTDDAEARALEALSAGDEAGFAELTERYRRELQVHCYRMLGSFEEAEDLVQETFLRAWRKRESFEGRSTFRSWLYRIATNASLDAIEKRKRRLGADRKAGEAQPGDGSSGDSSGPAPAGSFEVTWLQPYPDSLLEGVASPEAEPDAAAISKETIELAFLAAIQHLPPSQRAVLILRGVLDWPAKDTAEMLETTVASVNSALQRARATLRELLPERRSEWAAGSDPSAQERALLKRYVEANDAADADAFVELMHEDARFAMPPQPETWVGARTIVEAWKAGGFGSPGFGEVRSVVTRANMQPAVACYRRPPGESTFRPFALDVLRIEQGLIAEIVAFPLEGFEAFELPPTL